MSEPRTVGLYNSKNACADLGPLRRVASARKLGDPTILKQAEADVASFEDDDDDLGADKPDERAGSGRNAEGRRAARGHRGPDNHGGYRRAARRGVHYRHMRDFCKCDRIAKLKCGHQFHSLCVVGHVDEQAKLPDVPAQMRGPDFNVRQTQMSA